MCARYSLSPEESAEIARIIKEISDNCSGQAFKTGEIFPTETVPVMTSDDGATKYKLLKWGFPQHEGKSIIINARAETVKEKRIFKNSILKRRCLIPCSGFFEWAHSGKKDKYLFKLPNTDYFYLAGIYDHSNSTNNFAILTTEANESISDIHTRMPIILNCKDSYNWLHDSGFALDYLNSKQPIMQRKITQSQQLTFLE